MTSKILVPVTDKNGVQTARWKNPQASSSERSQAVSAPVTAVSDTPMTAPETVMVRDSQGVMHTIPTDHWTQEAEDVYAAGQCPAIAASLADYYPDATIKVMTNMGDNVLIHAWLEDGGMMIDAAGYAYFDEQDYIDEMYYIWGTPEVVEHTPESLKEWVEKMSPGTQNWEGAEWMMPAWMAEHVG